MNTKIVVHARNSYKRRKFNKEKREIQRLRNLITFTLFKMSFQLKRSGYAVMSLRELKKFAKELPASCPRNNVEESYQLITSSHCQSSPKLQKLIEVATESGLTTSYEWKNKTVAGIHFEFTEKV